MTFTDQQKILIVDDAIINIQVLNELLKGEYRVFFATRGSEALDIATTALPDLIMLDIMMPDMDGYDICRKLKADPLLKEIPVIFITAMSQEQDEVLGLELGAVDYITKPFNLSLVRLRVRNQLELKRQRDILERLSLMDGLTGLPNRRAFDECFDREWRRAWRKGWDLSLIMLDIDYFKAYNDTYGHIAGDDCLKRIGSALAATLGRGGDFIARYGGEEFICVLPNTDTAGATAMGEKLRTMVEELQIPHQTSSISPSVTISLGVAHVTPDKGVTPESLVEQADAMLYRAKRDGRNRVASLPG
ncbi:MAG: diguanylate cyclase [Geobacter sp.]|nr:diguanylate cyclase [Geobacter sp.]